MFLATALSALSIAGQVSNPRAARVLGVSRAAKAPALPRPGRARRLGLRRAAHPLLVDTDGVWAWPSGDAYAAPTRHASLQSWLEAHPSSELRVWLSSRVVSDGSLDLETLQSQTLRHGVQLKSVSPWWSHAQAEAARCMPVLTRSGVGQIGVVEAHQVSWVVTRDGMVSHVDHVTLHDSSVGALQAVVMRKSAEYGGVPAMTAVLGHGLPDGRHSKELDAHVLGRLDGTQPPHWLRPGGWANGRNPSPTVG